MKANVHIFLIAVAFILAVTRIAFSFIKRRDRENGLYLNDRSYTILGMLRLLFLPQDKRIEKEKEVPFSELLKQEREIRKFFYLAAAGYCAVLLLCSILLYFTRGGMSYLIITNLSLVAIAVSYMMSKGTLLTILMMVYGIFTIFLATASTWYFQIPVLLAGIYMFFIDIVVKKKCREGVRSN